MNAESKTRMTEGSISKRSFFLPFHCFSEICFSSCTILRDSLIVGNFLGSNALAAVSSSGNLIFLMVGFINGIAMGAGVVIARYYGAKKRSLQKAIHTTVAFGLAAGACPDCFGDVSGAKDSGADGNSCGCAPAIDCIFPYIFCRFYGCCHVQYFCWSSAVGR